MKKRMIAVLVMLFLLPLNVRAEETQPQTTEHTHSWVTETQAPTCTEPGASVQICSTCDANVTQVIPAAGHSFGGWADAGDGTHSRVCGVCAAAESASHNWDAGQVTAAPSCSTTGTKIYTCSCGAQKSEAMEVTDHAYGAWSVSDTAHSRSCACGKTESASHSWDVSATVPATCLEEGATAYGCLTCGAITYEILPKLTTHTYDNSCDPECNVCGAARTAEHRFSTQWSKNSKGHWYACSACGEQKDFGNHYPGPAATEEKAQICLTCGYTLTAKLGHTHKYETKYSSDETGHWYACSGCEEQKNFEEHSYDAGCDPDCNDCGYLTATAHSYSGTWFSDASGHWDVCTVCQEKSKEEPHIPGPEATEKQAQVCEACGYELAPVQVHVHEEDGSWLADEDTHWKQCGCGEELAREAHVWDDGTEQEDTTVRFECGSCGAICTEGVPRTGGHPLVWIGVCIAALLVMAAVLLVLLIPRLKKSGKYRK